MAFKNSKFLLLAVVLSNYELLQIDLEKIGDESLRINAKRLAARLNKELQELQIAHSNEITADRPSEESVLANREIRSLECRLEDANTRKRQSDVTLIKTQDYARALSNRLASVIMDLNDQRAKSDQLQKSNAYISNLYTQMVSEKDKCKIEIMDLKRTVNMKQNANQRPRESIAMENEIKELKEALKRTKPCTIASLNNIDNSKETQTHGDAQHSKELNDAKKTIAKLNNENARLNGTLKSTKADVVSLNVAVSKKNALNAELKVVRAQLNIIKKSASILNKTIEENNKEIADQNAIIQALSGESVTNRSDAVTLACSICTSSIEESASIVATKCGHIYHNDCLQQWLNR